MTSTVVPTLTELVEMSPFVGTVSAGQSVIAMNLIIVCKYFRLFYLFHMLKQL